jgi:ADP-ribosylglycohydrolase
MDYVDRVYAGVLGKLIGVYLGRPFEGWTYDRIMHELGEIRDYVQTRPGVPLVITDDDITGTFTFVRALADNGYPPELTAKQIGDTWLNYTIEGRTIFWWGGLGNSTEHTAYLRMKRGIQAPESGSIATNGKTIAEQIGAQIFIDGWAMVSPGDPERAADLARRAASVSHDGEAVFGAQVIAAMESHAFIESDLQQLLDTATKLIPADSTINRVITDVREWHAKEPDWRQTRELIAANYGYDKYRGPCHMVPNHALIHLALLYGNDDFRESLMIVNTSGWDTDCNSGNVGCLLGIKNGFAGLETLGVDWRGPIADRLYLATADGGRAITDAVTEAYHLVNAGRALQGQPALRPKRAARFHFEAPGSVQGFRSDNSDNEGENSAWIEIKNIEGGSERGARSLELRLRGDENARSARVSTPTFIPPEAVDMPGYLLLASPTLYPGQRLTAGLSAVEANDGPLSVGIFLRHYGDRDQLVTVEGPTEQLRPGSRTEIVWQIPDTGGQPIAEIGVQLRSDSGHGSVLLDFLDWRGEPDAVFTRPQGTGKLWRRAWVDAVSQFDARWPESFRIVQNEGIGMLSQGTPSWRDYRLTSTITPYLARRAGIADRVQGLRRYYALLLSEGTAIQLIKAHDGNITVLAEKDHAWDSFSCQELSLEVAGTRLRGWLNGELMFDVADDNAAWASGSVALLVEDGCLGTDAVKVSPAPLPSETPHASPPNGSQTP